MRSLAKLPGKAAWQSCLAKLPGKAAWQSCLLLKPCLVAILRQSALA